MAGNSGVGWKGLEPRIPRKPLADWGAASCGLFGIAWDVYVSWFVAGVVGAHLPLSSWSRGREFVIRRPVGMRFVGANRVSAAGSPAVDLAVSIARLFRISFLIHRTGRTCC